MKHQLPGIYKKPCKHIYSTNGENSDNGINLLLMLFFVCLLNAAIKGVTVGSASEFLLLVRMPEGETGSLGTTLLASSQNYTV